MHERDICDKAELHCLKGVGKIVLTIPASMLNCWNYLWQ